ncbi:MAG: PAS domain S-box protein, partial [Deltaproteobacteria bacterium]|nr:PAS domain S-box protein [Deltaproteobacteria bacterium]
MYRAANPAFCQFIGKKEQEIIGKTDFDLFPHDEAEMYRRDDARVMEAGIHSVQDEEVSGGEGKKWLQVAKTPIFDETGRNVGVLCSVRDISKRKRAENALQVERDRAQKYLDVAGVMLIAIDVDQKVILINRKGCEILGYNEEDIIGKNWFQNFLPQKISKEVSTVFKKLVAGEIEPVEYFENPVVTKDGKERIIAWHNTILTDEQGTIRCTLSSGDDITDRKQSEEEKKKLEAQFRESQKMEAIGTLAGGIAHDFNNLLTVIQGTSSLMLYDVDSKDPHYELLQMITKQVRRGAKLTAQLLGYASKGRYEVKPISLNQIVEETSDTFGRTHKEITIHQEFTDDLSSIEADQSQIEQVLLNLYINASGAMPRGGTLTLK